MKRISTFLSIILLLTSVTHANLIKEDIITMHSSNGSASAGEKFCKKSGLPYDYCYPTFNSTSQNIYLELGGLFDNDALRPSFARRNFTFDELNQKDFSAKDVNSQSPLSLKIHILTGSEFKIVFNGETHHHLGVICEDANNPLGITCKDWQ